MKRPIQTHNTMTREEILKMPLPEFMFRVMGIENNLVQSWRTNPDGWNHLLSDIINSSYPLGAIRKYRGIGKRGLMR